jgi:tetratricopeptide (TPR) repeat protein
LKECLKLNPKFALAWKQLGHIYYEANNSQNACKFYTKALESDPTDIESKIGIANCQYLLENFDAAIKHYEEISSIDLNDEIEYNLANCYYMKGEIQEAIKHYQNSINLNS